MQKLDRISCQNVVLVKIGKKLSDVNQTTAIQVDRGHRTTVIQVNQDHQTTAIVPKKEFEQDKAALKLEQENMHLNSFGNDYYGSNGDESFARRRKKFLQLKKRCKNAKRQEKDLRKEFEEQSGTGWRGKLERLKKMLTKH
ncbi:hypothetical protein BDEG_28424 [Batrachochytrium dendrobatidis JEL423]|uniref:Uncharacterized protein n=1 Tax=Batrachochytrium dendrobatidis (strain JEL423) TaxID=403673 RepID=A0A177WYV3_BATDL|nr:hypothetical protein BDEG_28424 [Batrachochytrium dendrobatidis JEL423]